VAVSYRQQCGHGQTAAQEGGEVRAIEAHMEFPDPAPGPEEELQSAQRFRILEAALQRLQEDYRQVLLLREVEEMSYAEIGDVLGLREGTVKSRIARARQALLEVCKGRI